MTPPRYTFHDYHPTLADLHAEVVAGLSRSPKAIPPKFFYDARGSELFEAICAQPEYYLPDVERALLRSALGEIREIVGQGRVLIEPGAGSLRKVRWLLPALRPGAYVPMDISREFLRTAATALTEDHPWLRVHAACADFTTVLPIPEVVPPVPRLGFFPGSSLGNFDPEDACAFLGRIHEMLGHGGMLLIGVDTRKARSVLDAAYNDAAGFTARFNLNLLHRIRRELDADCDPDGFTHRAFYDPAKGRVEMHLVSRRAQHIRVGSQRFSFGVGETLRTECSYKYAPGEFLDLARRAGFDECRHWIDRAGWFGLYLLAA